MRDNRSQILSLAEQRIKLLYNDAYTRALKIGEVRNALNAATNSNFTFKANPRAAKELRKILEELGLKIDSLINNGEKTLSKDGVKMAESNILAKVAASDKPLAERLIQAAAKTNRIDQAMGMELANKKRGGVTLSDRIWKTVSASSKELEIIIQNNIIEGKGADVASREVRQYLNDPKKLYRRVKDKETGEYKLSKAAQQYHPGQGKYRSSYMNARRLTVTEMNMATQAAESAAYASNPLIAGYEIRLSNNHTVKDPNKPGKVKPLHDICDELQGKYPPTFKFTGWHCFCRCSMIPILISPEERRKLAQARAEGKEYQPKGIITDVPANYKQWVAKNQQRIANAKTLPFFLQDNGEMTKDGYVIGEFSEPTSDEPITTTTTTEPSKSNKKQLVISQKPLKEYVEDILKTGRGDGTVAKVGNMNKVVIDDLATKGVKLSDNRIIIDQGTVTKYSDHPKTTKGASLPFNDYELIKKTLSDPIKIYEEIDKKDFIYVYTNPYDKDKVLKVVVHPNYSRKGRTYNYAKSIGLVKPENMNDKKIYRLIYEKQKRDT